MCKNVPSDFALPKHLLFICQNRANKTNTALSISIIPFIKAIFGLSGLEFCQNLQICMPNLVMLITHFGQKFKNPPPKCPSRVVATSPKNSSSSAVPPVIFKLIALVLYSQSVLEIGIKFAFSWCIFVLPLIVSCHIPQNVPV